jgi:hypothetical protein
MVMLTGYMDETGHSKDEKQRFVGMAGLVAPAENWEAFEHKWNEVLSDFKIPHFHMKDFANRKRHFEGWHELKRKKLLGKLMRIMASTHALPVGSITSMEDFRSLSEEDRQLAQDPYFFSFLGCVFIPTNLLHNHPPDVRLALVFGEQTEFQGRAARIFEATKEMGMAERLETPIFRDMTRLVPLQGADIVAYELYKEAERGATGSRKSRGGAFKNLKRWL